MIHHGYTSILCKTCKHISYTHKSLGSLWCDKNFRIHYLILRLYSPLTEASHCPPLASNHVKW